MANAAVVDGGDLPTTQLQPEKLAVIEHLPVVPVAPPMESVRLISTKNVLIRDEIGNECSPLFSDRLKAGKVLSIWLLEKSTSMFVTAMRIVIFDCEHAMPRRTGIRPRISIEMSTARAGAPVSSRGTVFSQRSIAMTALSRSFAVGDFVQFAAT